MTLIIKQFSEFFIIKRFKLNKKMSQQNQFYPRTQKQNPRLNKMSDMKFTNSKIVEQIPKKKPSTAQQKQSKHNQSSSQDQQPTRSFSKTCCPSSPSSKQKLKNFLCSWLFFIIAFIIYLLIWIIGHFSIQRITSYYYFNEYNISPYTSLEYWQQSQRVTNSSSQTYVLSTSIYSSQSLHKADAIALSLLFSWVMWKLPLTIFTLSNLNHHHNNKKKHSSSLSSLSLPQYSMFGFYLILLLLIDIMVTIFKPQGYQDWIFFVVYFVLSIVLIVVDSGVGKKSKVKRRVKLFRGFRNYLFPMLYIVVVYVAFSLLVPGIYGAIYKSLANDAAYIIVHIFPIIDLIFYSLIILISYYCDPHILKFIKMFQFLNIGYAIGHLILFSPEDVEFYFLVVYFIVRNLSFNWILQRVQKYVIIPCPQPGWIMVYLFSLSVNFVPFVAVGKLVVSKSFYSQMLQLTLPIQSYLLPKDYYAYEQSLLPEYQTFNPALHSNIQISTIFIVWVLTTITQKYHISKVEFKQLFFYIFGIYMFYFGLVTGSQLYYLQANSV